MIKSLPMLMMVAICCVNDKGKVDNFSECLINDIQSFKNNNSTTFIDTRIRIEKGVNNNCLRDLSIWYTPYLEYSYIKGLNYSNTNQTIIIIDYELIENQSLDENQQYITGIIESIADASFSNIQGFNSVSLEEFNDSTFVCPQNYEEKLPAPGQVIYVDVRQIEQYQHGIINDSLRIPLNQLMSCKLSILDGRQQQLFILSSESRRAKIALSMINSLKNRSNSVLVDLSSVNMSDQRFKLEKYTFDIWDSEQFKFVPVLIEFIAQLICMVLFIPFVYMKRDYYPHKQNSPILTCYAMFFLFMANNCLILMRINIGTDIMLLCQDLYHRHWSMWVLSLFYTFCQELVIFLYLLKLVRLLPAYFDKFPEKLKVLLKSQWKLLMVSCVWATFWVALEAGLKKTDNRGLQLYTFLCDPKCSNENQDGPYIIFYVKMLIYLVCYTVAYTLTYRVNENLNFRGQYSILLLMYYIPLIGEIIAHLKDETGYTGNYFHCQYSAALLLFYLSLISNLFASFFILALFVNTPKEEKFIPQVTVTLLETGDVLFILKKGSDTRLAFTGYCDSIGKSIFYQLADQIKQIDYNQKQQNDQLKDWVTEVAQKLKKHTEELKEKYSFTLKQIQGAKSQMKKAKLYQNIIYDETRSMLTNEWRKTNSYHVLYEELARVEEQEMKLKDLNLD